MFCFLQALKCNRKRMSQLSVIYCNCYFRRNFCCVPAVYCTYMLSQLRGCFSPPWGVLQKIFALSPGFRNFRFQRERRLVSDVLYTIGRTAAKHRRFHTKSASCLNFLFILTSFCPPGGTIDLPPSPQCANVKPTTSVSDKSGIKVYKHGVSGFCSNS